MKEFDLEAAKAGKPVCTRDGKDVRIICFDRKGTADGISIVALVREKDNYESICTYYLNGKYHLIEGFDLDLMMKSEKIERWVNIYYSPTTGHKTVSLYETEKEAMYSVDRSDFYIGTAKIELEV